jgi:hypothetical protein
MRVHHRSPPPTTAGAKRLIAVFRPVKALQGAGCSTVAWRQQWYAQQHPSNAQSLMVKPAAVAAS